MQRTWFKPGLLSCIVRRSAVGRRYGIGHNLFQERQALFELSVFGLGSFDFQLSCPAPTLGGWGDWQGRKETLPLTGIPALWGCWIDPLPASGDYYVTLSLRPGWGTTGYSMTVAIPAE